MMTEPLIPILNDEQIRRINTIARLGANKAAESLSKWIGAKIVPTTAKAAIVHYSKLFELSPSSEDIVTAILIPISGGISGHILFIFSEISTKRILTRVLHRDIDSLSEWDALRRSAMEETGNIIGASFANTLAGNLDLNIHPSSPVMACDFAGAFWDTLLTHYDLDGEYTLSLKITFNSPEDQISGTFSIIPSDLNAWKDI